MFLFYSHSHWVSQNLDWFMVKITYMVNFIFFKKEDNYKSRRAKS